MLKDRRLTGSGLKMIAMVSMFIDHMGAVLLLPLLQGSVRTESLSGWIIAHWDSLVSVYYYLRYIGRFAFPIYCFLLVEGFVHTRSTAKYALRLASFCLISEIPFDLAFNGAFLEFSSNNVFFTLLMGLLSIWALDVLLNRVGALKSAPWRTCLQALSIGLIGICGFYIAEYILLCDYAGQGVLAILVMYLLRKWPVAGFTAGTCVLCVNNSIERYALFMILPVALYGGQRGKPMKLAPYLFYPVHLLLLWSIARFLL